MTNVVQLPAVESRDCEQHGPYEVRLLPSLIPGGRGHWFGECPQCAEARKREEQEREHSMRVMQLLQRSGIPTRYEGKRFSGFKPRTTKQTAALQACQEYAADLERNLDAGTCLVLLGPAGVGKSHLLTAILEEAIDALCPAQYATAADFLSAISGNWAWHGQDAGKPFTRAPLLALDELSLPEGGRDREALFALIDDRYRGQLPTLLASNMTWPEMKQSLGERLCDRLLENGGRVVVLDGESYRGK